MFRSLIGSLVLTACCVAHAAPVVDQISQPAPSLEVITGFGFIPTYAQSFRPSSDNVTGAGFLLGDLLPNPVDLRISLYSALPSPGTAARVSVAPLASTLVSGAVGWADAFWKPVTVVANQTYFLVIEPFEENIYFIGGRSYAGGQAYKSERGDPTLYPFEGDVDFVFRTYADEAAIPNPVPEPATIALIGLAGLAAFRRRRRA